MKYYLYSIVTVSVASSLFRALCPNSASLKKYFSFLTSVVLLCATVLPISSLIDGIRVGAGLFSSSVQTESRDYRAVWLEHLSGKTKEENERAILAHICDKFDISDNHVTVNCTLEEESGIPHLIAVDITLNSSALLKNPRQIESYLREVFDVDCTVSDGSVLRTE